MPAGSSPSRPEARARTSRRHGAIRIDPPPRREGGPSALRPSIIAHWAGEADTCDPVQGARAFRRASACPDSTRAGTTAISLIHPKLPDEKAREPEHGLSNVKRAELIARLAELDHLIEEQTAHVKFVREMGWDVPVVAERLERLKESRQLYLSALRHLLGESIRPGGVPNGDG